MSMTLNDYQKDALVTAMFSGNELLDICHWTLGITGEGGEIAEKVKKIIRDNNAVISDEVKAEIVKEIGDVLWYLAVLAKQLGVSFEEIGQANIAKLRSRQARDKIKGSGDNR